jgi:hypothetical protein
MEGGHGAMDEVHDEELLAAASAAAAAVALRHVRAAHAVPMVRRVASVPGPAPERCPSPWALAGRMEQTAAQRHFPVRAPSRSSR